MLISTLRERRIPQQFRKGRPIEQVILVCDVDGVIRSSTEAHADSQIVALVKDLVSNHNVDAAFISGTPITHNPLLEKWRKGNCTLDKAVGQYFKEELEEKKVALYGSFGGQRIIGEDRIEITDQYSLDVTFEIGKILLHAFLEEVKNKGTNQQKKYAEDLKPQIDELQLMNTQQTSVATPNEFADIVSKIHSQLDPQFKLISYGPFVESQTSNPPWGTKHSAQWIKGQLNSPESPIAHLPEDQKELATGLGHRDQEGFNFTLISKLNKHATMQKHLKEKLLLYPDALIITIGDTQVDFPMHQHAHLAYHVGLEKVWKDHNLSHCMLVRDQFGQDQQHVTGTRFILNSLKKNIGKPYPDWDI